MLPWPGDPLLIPEVSGFLTWTSTIQCNEYERLNRCFTVDELEWEEGDGVNS